jgi:hypothetical protein
MHLPSRVQPCRDMTPPSPSSPPLDPPASWAPSEPPLSHRAAGTPVQALQGSAGAEQTGKARARARAQESELKLHLHELSWGDAPACCCAGTSGGGGGGGEPAAAAAVSSPAEEPALAGGRRPAAAAAAAHGGVLPRARVRNQLHEPPPPAMTRAMPATDICAAHRVLLAPHRGPPPPMRDAPHHVVE